MLMLKTLTLTNPSSMPTLIENSRSMLPPNLKSWPSEKSPSWSSRVLDPIGARPVSDGSSGSANQSDRSSESVPVMLTM